VCDNRDIPNIKHCKIELGCKGRKNIWFTLDALQKGNENLKLESLEG
jgi:hypothetical protein